MSALSELLNRHFAERFPEMSNRKIAEASGVSRGTIDNYRNGTHPTRPSEEVLQAFHELLRIPMPELREAAGLQPGELDPYVPPAEANRLGMRQRRALDELIRSFVESPGVSNAEQPATDTADPTPAARAQGTEDQKNDVKPTDLSERRSRREALPERPDDAIAARRLDPKFGLEDAGADGIGEENQDTGWDE